MNEELTGKYMVRLCELDSFAHKSAQIVKSGLVITVEGDIGAGKTTFIRKMLAQSIDTKEIVTSPTFNLLHTYPCKGFLIWHFDLYRLKTQKEVWELGLDEALDTGCTIIEWPQLIEDELPRHNRLKVKIDFTPHSDLRNFAVEHVI